MAGVTDRRRARARAEGQRKRLIWLLEELSDVDHKEQCPKCGEWFDAVASHEPHCDGPD